MDDSLAQLRKSIHTFAGKRNWQQFHSPKNLSMALIVEAAELVEHFQWLSQQQSHSLDDTSKKEVAMEMADVFIYLIRLADQLDIDLLAAAREKMAINNKKYPAELCAGKSDKYTRYR